MNINLAYGQAHLSVELPDDQTTVIIPKHLEGLTDERAAVLQSLDNPTGMPPLRDLIRPTYKVCITFTDITRATPNDRLIPWLLEYLDYLPKENIMLVNQNGTHRANTRAELKKMLTPNVVANYSVLNNESKNRNAYIQLGTMRDGTPALINRHVVEADIRIVTGFIEPHFFAGFSGGVKGIVPGTAAFETIMSNHGAHNIGHPNACFGLTDGNPLWEELRDVALRVGPSFLLNVTLNEQRQITAVFAGDLTQAHKCGCEFVRESAMQKVTAPFDIVIITNSGYPLDLNLYQGVKGMSAAARIVKPGGTIILACECREGVPPNSPYDRLLRRVKNLEEFLSLTAQPGFAHADQWEVQIQAQVQRKAQVLVYSSLSDEIIRAAHLTPCHDISAETVNRLKHLNSDARVAVLPQGPLTIPYLD
ncbi:MAG: nickel-dependent lactate racemase [archaeon]